MKQLKRIFLLSVLVVIVGFGASLTLKVAIGVGAWDAVAQSLNFLTGIKVGTIGMAMNISCVVGQWILLKKEFGIRHLLQVPISVLIGTVINFFFYEVLGAFTFDNYAVSLTVFMVANVMIAFAISAVMVLDVVTFPLEGLCMAVSRKLNKKFPPVRQAADFISIVVAVLLSLAFSLPLTVREGTVIGMLILSPLMGLFMAKIRPILSKHDFFGRKCGSEIV